MVKHLNSLGEMAVELLTLEVAERFALERGLEKVLKLIEAKAKAEFGHYQSEIGPFPAWPELADSTKERRVAAGYTENDPLLASGELMESLEHERQGLEGAVGTRDPKMEFLEFGTSKMPARPVLGPAGFSSKEAIQKLVGAAVVAGLVGKDVVHEALGYDFETGG